jgi:hypothetical protein
VANLRLRDPERCPKCGGLSQVIDTRRELTHRWRRRRCLLLTCAEGRQRTVWYTYESLINPEAIRLRTARTT